MKIYIRSSDGALDVLIHECERRIQDFELSDNKSDAHIIISMSQSHISLATADGTEKKNIDHPSHPSDLIHHLKLLHRQYAQSSIQYKSIKTDIFDMNADRLSFKRHDSDQEEKLTEKEYSLLQILYDAPEKWLSKEDLLQKIWGYGDDIETHTLETHIYRLRQKIEQEASKPTIFINENQGYRLHI